MNKRDSFLNSLILLAMSVALVVPNGLVIAFVVIFFTSLLIPIKHSNFEILDVRDKAIIFSFFLFFISVIPVFIMSDFRGRYLDLTLRYIFAIPLILVFINNPPKVKFLFFGVMIGTVIGFFYAFHQYYWIGLPRARSFLYSINYGYLICSLSFLSLSAAFYFDRFLLKTLAVLSFILGVYGTFLTGTRGAYIAIPVVILTGLWLYRSQLGWKGALSSLVVIALSIVLVYQFIPQVQNRMDSLVKEIVSYEAGHAKKAASSSALRIELWRASYEAFKISPLFGLTYEQREEVNKNLIEKGLVAPKVAQKSRGHAHSDFFEILASRGLVGVIALFIFYGAPLLIFRSLSKESKDKKVKAVAFAGTSLIVGFIVFGLSEAPLQQNTLSAYLILSIVIIYSELRHKFYKEKKLLQ